MPITELRVKGLRTLEDVCLRLDGLTVLIGDNGSGKSSLIEACEILRRAAGEEFWDELHTIHGGMSALLRQGADRLELGVTVSVLVGAGETAWLNYDLVIAGLAPLSRIEEEVLSLQPGPDDRQGPTTLLRRGRSSTQIADPANAVLLSAAAPYPERLDLVRSFSALTSPMVTLRDPEVARRVLRNELMGIQVHLPFEVLPAWAARALSRRSDLRGTALVAPAGKLEKLGVNLANAYQALKNNFGEAHWRETMDLIRLGLGPGVEDVTTWADPGGGQIGLGVKLRRLDRQVLSGQLSDGMLSYLAFVALYRLAVGAPPSLLAFDEPDLHLHPQLLMRLLDFFESLSARTPVLLATHSDRLLDGLSDPARSVVLCELDERQATRLLRPDPEALARWLKRYRGLGDLRGEGYEGEVLTVPEGRP